MDANIQRSFILPDCLAAVSSVMTENHVLATDGATCNIYEFSNNGCFDECHKTIHPYRRFRKNQSCEGYTAAVSCSPARIYYIANNFIEQGYTELSTSHRNSCGCSDFCELTDVSAITIGNEKFIVGAFQTAAYLFDSNGKRLTRLCSTERNEILTDFVYSGEGLFAYATATETNREISVSDNGTVQTALLGKNNNLRMIFIQNGQIFGLFGQNYIYNRIYKIYSNGKLWVPT